MQWFMHSTYKIITEKSVMTGMLAIGQINLVTGQSKLLLPTKTVFTQLYSDWPICFDLLSAIGLKHLG